MGTQMSALAAEVRSVLVAELVPFREDMKAELRSTMQAELIPFKEALKAEVGSMVNTQLTSFKEEMRAEVGAQFTSFREEVNARFDVVNAQFTSFREEVNAKFDEVNAHFEKVHAKFKEVDLNFEKINVSIEGLKNLTYKLDMAVGTLERSHVEFRRELKEGFSSLNERVGSLEERVSALEEGASLQISMYEANGGGDITFNQHVNELLLKMRAITRKLTQLEHEFDQSDVEITFKNRALVIRELFSAFGTDLVSFINYASVRLDNKTEERFVKLGDLLNTIESKIEKLLEQAPFNRIAHGNGLTKV